MNRGMLLGRYGYTIWALQSFRILKYRSSKYPKQKEAVGCAAAQDGFTCPFQVYAEVRVIFVYLKTHRVTQCCNFLKRW